MDALYRPKKKERKGTIDLRCLRDRLKSYDRSFSQDIALRLFDFLHDDNSSWEEQTAFLKDFGKVSFDPAENVSKV
jgi:hypothetical protein